MSNCENKKAARQALLCTHYLKVQSTWSKYSKPGGRRIIHPQCMKRALPFVDGKLLQGTLFLDNVHPTGQSRARACLPTEAVPNNAQQRAPVDAVSQPSGRRRLKQEKKADPSVVHFCWEAGYECVHLPSPCGLGTAGFHRVVVLGHRCCLVIERRWSSPSRITPGTLTVHYHEYSASGADTDCLDTARGHGARGATTALLGHRTVESSAIGPHQQTYALNHQVSRGGAATHIVPSVRQGATDHPQIRRRRRRHDSSG